MADPTNPSHSAPPSNDALATALRACAEGTASRGDVYQPFLEGPVLVPTIRPVGAGESRVAVFPTPEGGQVVLAFSDLESLRSWSSEAETMVTMNGVEAARLARRHRVDGVLLNAGSPASLSLAPAEMDMLADGLVPVESGSAAGRVAAPSTRRLRPSRLDYPEALRRYFRTLVERPEVEAVHLVDIRSGDQEPIPTVAVRLAPGASSGDRLLQEVAEHVATFLPVGKRVDVSEADDALHQEATRAGAFLT